MAIKYLNALAINGNGGTVLDVQGSQGQLFSVTDSLTGDIFAVSDISGVPILKVNSSGLSTFAGDVTSPTFLGDLNGTINTATTGTTQTTGDNSTKIATTAYADAAAAAVPIGDYVTLATTQTITGAKTINTLKIGSANRIQFANNDFIRYDDAIGVGRFHFDSDGGTNNSSVQAATFVGDLAGTINTATTGVTQTAGDNSTKIATTAYVDGITPGVGVFLPLAGGIMTGAINMQGNSINGSNYNISGVNQLTINDPGEGIVFSGTTNVNLYVVDDTTDSIVNFDNASEIRRNGVRVADVPYIASRSQQLMTNYNGLLGNNYNFPGWTFDGQEANYSPGSFKFVGSGGGSYTSEYIAVDTAYKYKMSLDAKTLNGVGRYYCMTLCYDVDQNQINAQHHMYRANTSTTLAVALNPGDTTVTLAGTGSNWYDGGTAGVSTHLRSLIIWEYTNSLGYTYPPETYSRLWYSNAWDPNNISGNVITLRTAWTGPSYPVGTQLSNGSSGGSYKYNVMSYKLLTTDWTQSVGFMDGVDLSGTNVSTKFPPGTAKIRMGFLPNYNSGSTGADTIWITNFNIGIDNVLTKGDQSIAGTKTFTTVPVVGTMLTADDSTSAASTAWVKDQGYNTATVGDGQINGEVAGNGLSGSMSATANQSGDTTFTVTSNAVTAATANTIAYRDASADLTVRLLRANYADQTTISGAMAFRVDNGTDNYTRYCNSPSAIRTFLGVPASGDLGSYLPLAGGIMTGKIGRSSAATGFLEGSYNNVGDNSSNSNPIYTIGSSYNPSSTTLSEMYGIGYTHGNNASFMTLSGATGWGMYVASDGDARVWLDGGNGNISTTGSLYLGGSEILGDAKTIIRFDDSWLRINPDNEFVSGIYCSTGILRTDGTLQVGNAGDKFQVDADGNIRIRNRAQINQQENTNIDAATSPELVAQVPISYTAAFFDFVVKKGTNIRSGTVYACHDGTNVEFTETSTNDLGDTSDVVLSVDKTSTNLRLIATVASDDWSVKSLIRAI